MWQSRQVTASFFKPGNLLPVLLPLLLNSCLRVPNAPVRKPFVYKSTIRVEGNMSLFKRQELETRLTNQIDDSLKTQIVSYVGIVRVLKNPPVFDTINVRRSTNYMTNLLNSLGYYSPVIHDSISKIDTVKHTQYRVTVNFVVNPGKQLKFDSIAYEIRTPELKKLVDASNQAGESLLKKGEPYSKQILASEQERLIALFQNNGYYKFPKDNIYFERDTVVSGLIDPTLDPFEQARLLDELKKKRENPTINITVKQRPIPDSNLTRKYYFGKITIYPDLPYVEDTTVVVVNDTVNVAKNVSVIERSKKFTPSFLNRNVYMRPGAMFRASAYDRTLNRFNQLSAWQQAAIDINDSGEGDSLLNASLRLYPAKKQYLSIDPEISRNTNDIITASNLFGVGANIALRNRNAFRQSVLTSTNLRAGVELGSNFTQTRQASLSHSISIPRFILPFPVKRDWRAENPRTVINANASYTDRRNFFTLRAINMSLGYEWTRNLKKGNTTITRNYIIKIPNIEYENLEKTDSLQKILDSIPSLKLAFKTGLVIGPQFLFSSIRHKDNKTHFLRISAEESGALLGFINELDQGDLFRFVKADIEYRYHVDINRSQLALRAYAGGGIAYGREGSGYEQTLPFYKAFFAGGPNSMRGWQVRQLGQGSTQLYDTGRYRGLDRFGDIQLEGNIEYRFPLGTYFGIKFQSALYTDIGNVWNRKVTDTLLRGSDFQLNRFINEFAVDAGTGLRLDFDYFLIRLDWAYRIRDPQRLEYPDRWFYGLTLGGGQFQLGIGYPF